MRKVSAAALSDSADVEETERSSDSDMPSDECDAINDADPQFVHYIHEKIASLAMNASKADST